MTFYESNNTTNATTEDISKYGPEEMVIFAVSFLAILGNVFVILTICLHARFKTNYYFLVAHVAVCDICIATTYILSFILRNHPINIFDNERYSRIILVVLPLAVNNVFYLSELFFIALIALLRYHAVAKPQKYFPRKKLLYLIVFIYLLSIAIGVTFFLFFLFINTRHTQVVRIIIFRIIPRLTAFAFLGGMYYKICSLLHTHSKNVHKEGNAFRNSYPDVVLARQKRNFRIAYKSSIIVVTFLLSNFPLSVWYILFAAGQSISLRYFKVLDIFFFSLYYIGTCVLNPIMYGLFDNSLMAGYKKICSRAMGCCVSKTTLLRKRSRFENKDIELDVICVKGSENGEGN